MERDNLSGEEEEQGRDLVVRVLGRRQGRFGGENEGTKQETRQVWW